MTKKWSIRPFKTSLFLTFLHIFFTWNNCLIITNFGIMILRKINFDIIWYYYVIFSGCVFMKVVVLVYLLICLEKNKNYQKTCLLCYCILKWYTYTYDSIIVRIRNIPKNAKLCPPTYLLFFFKGVRMLSQDVKITRNIRILQNFTCKVVPQVR